MLDGPPTTDVDPDGRPPQPVAVIDIGATSVRMAIAQLRTDGGVRILENLSQAISLGKDSFIKGRLERATIEDCVRVMQIYAKKLTEYQIGRDEVRIVGTSAVREAANRLAFLDRLYIATGFDIEPFDEAELHRVTYLAVKPALERQPELSQKPVVVCEIGGGSTEVLGLVNDSIEFSQTYRLGSLRLRRTLEAYHAPTQRIRDIMEREIEKTANQIREHFATFDNREFVTMGSDMRFLGSLLRPGENFRVPVRLEMDEVDEVIDQLVGLSVDALVHRHHLSLPDAESLAPALLAYQHIAQALGVTHLWVASANIRDGLLRDMWMRKTRSAEFTQQVTQSALDLAERFHVDLDHAKHVAHLCRSLFAELKAVHQLESQFELLLVVAALLHEVGLAIGHRSFHKHSMYIIANSEVFGVGKHELRVISLVARYHRRASPQPVHAGYAELDREQRVVVSKMAALLRIAKALDDSRNQRIHEIDVEVRPDNVVIQIPGVEDLALEKIALQQQGTLFEEVFGKRVVLRARPAQRSTY
ncbi:MAG: HD domain-containing protein [Planctomycetales bacterium]|nr:HD domain-containing protein [Planctomycetales bacterium]